MLRLHISTHNDDVHTGTAKRNLANGVAGLDASGYIIDSSGNIAITEDKKDINSGVAGLDVNGFLNTNPYQLRLEEYNNHLGNTDNYTETLIGGNGTVNEDTTNHEMDLSSGDSAVGYACYKTKKSYTIGTRPLIFTGIVQNIVKGAGGTRFIKIGILDNWISAVGSHEAVFLYYSTTNKWSVQTKGVGSPQYTYVTVTDGDILNIVIITGSVKYYINGTLVASHTTYPTTGIEAGFGVFSDEIAVSSSITCSADFISIKNYNI